MVHDTDVHYCQISVMKLETFEKKSQVFKNELRLTGPYIVDIWGKVEGEWWCCWPS